MLNDAAYGISLALSIDATAFRGSPIIFDPRSVLMESATVDVCIRSLNQRNCLKEWKTHERSFDVEVVRGMASLCFMD